MFVGLSENLRIFCSSVLNLICLKLVYEVSVGFDSSLGEEDIQKFEKRPKVVPLFLNFLAASKFHRKPTC